MGLVVLEELPRIIIADGISGKAVTAGTMTVMHVNLDKGAIVPEHSHYHEQVVNVIEGELELTVDGEKFSLTAGKVMVLPPNIVHSGRAKTEVKVIDVFHPVREDFAGSDFAGYTQADAD
jgi:quercetin dioxygenase-like cupin family protein